MMKRGPDKIDFLARGDIEFPDAGVNDGAQHHRMRVRFHGPGRAARKAFVKFGHLAMHMRRTETQMRLARFLRGDERGK